MDSRVHVLEYVAIVFYFLEYYSYTVVNSDCYKKFDSKCCLNYASSFPWLVVTKTPLLKMMKLAHWPRNVGGWVKVYEVYVYINIQEIVPYTLPYLKSMTETQKSIINTRACSTNIRLWELHFSCTDFYSQSKYIADKVELNFALKLSFNYVIFNLIDFCNLEYACNISGERQWYKKI